MVALVVAAFAPLVGTSRPAAAADPVLVGAGDIADCSTDADEATASLLDGIPGTVFTLGDNAYPDGSPDDFQSCYRPTWGRHDDRTLPALGNHEYHTSDAGGYFDYFDPDPGARGEGWYSYDLGRWHIVVLNSNCSKVGGCGAGSPQAKWLTEDLAGNARPNVLAYWHHPRFSSGTHGGEADVGTFWEILYAHGADVVLNGHDHDYERFDPQDPDGRADAEYGIRQFVVGTGGAPLRDRGSDAANSEVFSSSHGVLKLVLRASSYEWRFVPIEGGSFTDTGSGQTHAPPGDLRTATFTATSDAFVDQAHARANYGTRPRLYVDARTRDGGSRVSYIKFRVSGLSGTVRRASVGLFVTAGTADGPAIRATRSRWSGRTITWRHRPATIGGVIDDLGRTPPGGWIYLDVTPLIDGDGVYSFVLRGSSADGVTFSSMEGPHAPRLDVQTSP